MAIDQDELESDALAALALADQRFDPSKHMSFETYAWKRVRWAIQDWKRKNGTIGKHGVVRPGPGVPLWKTVNGVDLPMRLADPHDRMVEAENHAQLVELFRTLNSRSRRIVFEYFIVGDSQVVIAAREGVGESRISQIINQSLQQMRDAA